MPPMRPKQETAPFDEELGAVGCIPLVRRGLSVNARGGPFSVAAVAVDCSEESPSMATPDRSRSAISDELCGSLLSYTFTTVRNSGVGGPLTFDPAVTLGLDLP